MSEGLYSESAMENRRLLLLAVALVAPLAAVMLFGSGGGDDSHITWWVVDELWRTGHFHNLNSVTLEQSSSLALVLLVALLRAVIRIQTPALGVLFSLIATSATCLMTGVVSRRIHRAFGLPATALVATSGPLLYWGTSGMETALAAFSAVLLLEFLARQLDLPTETPASVRWKSYAALFGCSALFATVRPENPLLLGATTCTCVIVGFARNRPSSSARARILSVIVTIMAPVVLLLLWRHWIFHEWFPHPVSAKGGGGARWQEGWKYLIRHMNEFEPTMLLMLPASVLAILGSFFRRKANSLALVVGVYTALSLAFICASGGDWMSCGRFLTPHLPIWWLCVLSACSAVADARFVELLVNGGSILLSAANIWFLVGLAHNGSANGYPLAAAIKVVPKARAEYHLQRYSFIELANKSHLRDAVLSEELKRVVSLVEKDVPRKIWLASGQAGAVPYDVFPAFPDRLRFIDFWGLTTDEVIPCLPPAKLKHSALGVAASPELIFEYRDVIARDCGVPMADIVFNTSLHAGTKRGLEARGYRVVYFQRGAMPNFSEPSFLRGGTSMDAYIAVRKELAEKLNLKYKEVRWAISG